MSRRMVLVLCAALALGAGGIAYGSIADAGQARSTLDTETIKVTHADYYRSSSGTWLSVEAKSSAAQGNAAVPPGTPGCPATGSNGCGAYGGSTTGTCWGKPEGGASALSPAACPALTVTYSTDNGQTWQTGFQTGMFPNLDDGVYLYHSQLVKLALKADDATAPHLPILVRVTSNYGTTATREATAFLDTPPPYPAGFQHDFFSRYQTPEDGTALVEQLRAEYPSITTLIPVPYKTNGYRRNAMAAMGCTVSTSGGNTGLPGTPGASPAGFATPATCTGTAVQNAAVILNTWKFGEDTNDPTQNGNQVTMQFVNPGAPSSPLSVSVSGLTITVSLATDGAGALTSTAAEVVAALNANPAASAILSAATYRGNAGTGIVQPSSVVTPERLPLGAAFRRRRRSGLPGAAGGIPAIRPADLQGLRRLEDGRLHLRAGARPRVGRTARRAGDGREASKELRR